MQRKHEPSGAAEAAIAILWFCRDLTDPESCHVPAGVIAAAPTQVDSSGDASDWRLAAWIVPAEALGLNTAMAHLWTKLPVLMARLARPATLLGAGHVARTWMETFSGDQSSIVVVASVERVGAELLRAAAAKTLAACAKTEAEMRDDPVYRVVERLTVKTPGWCEASMTEVAGSGEDDDDWGAHEGSDDVDCDHRERDIDGDCIACGASR